MRGAQPAVAPAARPTLAEPPMASTLEWKEPALWPIAATALLIVAANLVFVGFRLLLPYPVSAWEAGMVTDAWRWALGHSPYAADSTRATTMYGPLTTLLLAQLFELSGPMLQAGRWISAIAGIATIGLLAFAFGRRTAFAFLVSVALLLAANSRTAYYFAETRPDLTSAFFATVALFFLYRSTQSGKAAPRLALAVAGSLLLMTAVMFKQTALVFVVAPAIAELAHRSGCRRWLPAAVPVVVSAIVIGAVWRFAPALWHAMVEIPARYGISARHFARYAAEFPTSLPLFVLALLHWLLNDARDNWRSARARWLIAALCCAVPGSLLAHAKAGGNENTLIPALLATSTFCVWRAHVVFELLRDAGRPLIARAIAGVICAILLLAQVYPGVGALSAQALRSGFGTADRPAVIAAARRLPGTLVSPDDPTIALMSKGYAGRTAVFEADAVGWNPDRVEALVDEITEADDVIVMRPGRLADGRSIVSGGGDLEWWPKEEVLKRMGFRKVDFPGLATPVYELWHRPAR